MRSLKLDFELYRRDVLIPEDPSVRLSAIDVNPPHAERMLFFLHGYGGRATLWEQQLRHFSEHSRVVALDLRGHGASDTPNSEYSMDELLGDVEVAVEQLNLPEKFVLVAHSFGGAIAATYALAHPERIEKLILVSVSGEFSLGLLLSILSRFPTALIEFFIRNFFTRQLSAPAHVLKKFYRRTLKGWRGWELFPQLRASTLVVYGERDFVFPVKLYRRVAESIPLSQSVVIPVSAHLVMLERADAVNRAIDRFLGKTAEARRVDAQKAHLVKERPWVAHYEDGVPSNIVLPSQPLHTMLTNAAKRHPKASAMIYYDRHVTYGELEDQSARFASSLTEMGVRKGDRVMVVVPNMPQAVIAFYGALKAGAVVVLSNPLSTERELERQVKDSGAQTIVALSPFYETVRNVANRIPTIRNIIVTSAGEYLPFRKWIAYKLFREKAEIGKLKLRSDPRAFRFQDLLWYSSPKPTAVTIQPEDLALVQYTGGTTDFPKGTMLTHLNLVANTLQVRHWLTDAVEGKERILCVLPFSHIYGLTACMNLAVSLAAAMILLPTFVTRQVLEAIAKHRPTFFPGVPTMYVAINNAPGVRKYRLSSIRACVSGAAPLPVEVQEAFEKLTKGRLVEGYGLTEASPVTHANPLRALRKTGSIGIPLPSTEAVIADIETGKPLATGDPGELLVRGPQVTSGYWNDPETSKLLLRDGWLHTGDIATVDEDGYFQIIDRKKDMIIAGKYNVYPRDVEEVLYEHPKVFEVAVAGVPPQRDDQVIKAYIVLKKGASATPEEFIELCKQRLPEYMVPKMVEFRRELPKSFVGKVLRRALIESEVLSKKPEQ